MHVQNFSPNDIVKNILKKKNDVHWISDRTVVLVNPRKTRPDMTEKMLTGS